MSSVELPGNAPLETRKIEKTVTPMLMIPCPVCNRPVSKQAIACPGCGHPIAAALAADAAWHTVTVVLALREIDSESRRATPLRNRQVSLSASVTNRSAEVDGNNRDSWGSISKSRGAKVSDAQGMVSFQVRYQGATAPSIDVWVEGNYRALYSKPLTDNREQSFTIDIPWGRVGPFD